MEERDDEFSGSMQVVIAALNEEQGIGRTISEFHEYVGSPRVLVVDGNSRDKTVQVAKDHGADIVFQDGRGKGDAIAKALEHLDPDVDYIVLTDADYTYPAEYVPEMVRMLEENPHVGMVCGNRFNHHTDWKAMHGLFYFGNRVLALTANMLNGVALRDPLTGLRVIRADILRGWKVRSKGFDIEVELNHQVERRGFTIKELDIAYRERVGEKKLKAKHAVTILKRILLETTY